VETLAEANRQYAERYLRYHYDADGMLVIEGRLPAEQGALVVQALESAADALREEQRQDGFAASSGEDASAEVADEARDGAGDV
jgi:hypothetical protein